MKLLILGLYREPKLFKYIHASNKAWSHMAAKAQPAKPTLAATSPMQPFATLHLENLDPLRQPTPQNKSSNTTSL